MAAINKTIIEQEIEFCYTYYGVRLFLNQEEEVYFLDKGANTGDRTIYKGDLSGIYIALKAYMDGLEDMQYYMSKG